MTDHTQPEALRLADAIKASGQFTNLHTLDEAAAELRRQQARIAELEAQLEAIGAGGVNGPLMAPAAAHAGSEPVAWRHRMGPTDCWVDCSKEFHDWVLRAPAEWPGNEVQALCIAAPPLPTAPGPADGESNV